MPDASEQLHHTMQQSLGHLPTKAQHSTAQHTCSGSFHHARAPTRPGGAAKQLGHLPAQLNCPAPVGRILFQAGTAVVHHSSAKFLYQSIAFQQLMMHC